MNRTIRLAIVCSLTLGIGCVTDPAPELEPTRQGQPPPGPPAAHAESDVGRLGVHPVAKQIEAADLHVWLTAERPPGVLAAPVDVPLTPAEIAAVDEQDPDNPGRVTVGISKATPHHVAFKGGDGVLTGTDDGGFLWSVALTSPGAGALRLHFANAHLPAGADLFLYNEKGEVYGPYQGAGPHGNGGFWTHSITGDTAIVAVRFYGQATDADYNGTSAVITEISFLGSRFSAIDGDATCSFNEPCVENGACFSNDDWGPFDDTSDAVAQLLFQSQRKWYICSGGLLADTDVTTETAYLLTANHCLKRSREAETLEAAFFYTSPECSLTGPDDTCPNVRDIGNKVIGARIVATNRDGDYTLLELDDLPPAGTTYMGWDATPIANSHGASLHRLSHPMGAPQSYSEHDVDTDKGTCSSWPRGSWIYSADRVGATEGGSSGSPVLDAGGYVVGQLSGACGTDVYNTCNAQDNATVDGALAAYFPEVASYLDPTPCTPEPEICTDGADNDCDGATDCADSDCSGDASCASSCKGAGTDPAGASCTSGATCCSGKCKGPPSNKSCR